MRLASRIAGTYPGKIMLEITHDVRCEVAHREVDGDSLDKSNFFETDVLEKDLAVLVRAMR